LALDNERLRAAVLARIAELQASRTRIVAEGDDERRRLERDLHDGAQQRLLALSYEIRVALAAARATALDAPLVSALERADATAQAAIAELRQLAHGIYPAILADTGLAPALASLSDDAPLPLSVEVRATGRCAGPVEVAAYHVVAQTVMGAARGGATWAAVSVDRTGDLLVVEVDDDGGHDRVGRDERLRDRVGAIGGSLWTGAGPGGTGRRLRAELPCA
jgi:signal transduction histidine kinase